MSVQFKFVASIIIAFIVIINPILAFTKNGDTHNLYADVAVNCVPTREAVFRKDFYHASWTADFETQTIKFHVIAATTGYVGFGLSNFTGMTNSDIVIGGVYPNGTSYFADYHALTNANPPEFDASQDWFLDSASENATHTELVFHRAFDTGDAENDHAINSDLTTFIWAVGGSDVTILSHGSANRNMYLVNVLNFQNCILPPIKEEVLTDKYTVRWSVDREAATIIFHVVAEAKGYVGLGLSYAGSTMFTGDFAIGGVYDNGTTFFGDWHGVGYTTPELDDSQDWILSQAQENETHTELVFWRKLDTLDFDHDSPITSKPVHLLWALGNSDNIGYHFGERGSKQVVLFEAIDCVA